MNNFIKKLLFFSLFTFVIYSILLILWEETYSKSIYRSNLKYFKGAPYGHMNLRMKEVKKVRNVDVLFLGSSHTYRGFDTRIFEKNNITSFNLGSSNQTPLQTNALVKRYLDELNPKFIIYEVYPNLLERDGVESALDIITNDDDNTYSLGMVLKTNNVKVYNTYLYDFLITLFHLDKPYIEPRKKGPDLYIQGGYVEKELQYAPLTKHEKKTWVFNKKQLIEFDNILSIINERKIKFILVFAPITSNYYHSISNIEVFDSTMNKKGEFYDFNKIMKLNDTLHFFDHHHLNQKGVNLFNNKLIKMLTE